MPSIKVGDRVRRYKIKFAVAIAGSVAWVGAMLLLKSVYL